MGLPRLVVTIDTEEDEWGRYDLPRYTVTNTERIVALQALFDRFGVKPTYLITNPVAESESAKRVLAPILARGCCEIGAHCHPWNTPPLVEDRVPRNSMLCNLPADLQLEKIRYLKGAIRCNFGVEPSSFRAGRWGFGTEVARNLAELGFKVDSSITPFISWRAYDGPDFDRPYPERYRLSLTDLSRTDNSSPLVEVPVTTGFSGLLGGVGYPIHWALARRALVGMWTRGLVGRMGIFRMTWLCPEMTVLQSMTDLSERLCSQGARILNLMFHSVTLKAGLTPFVRSAADERRFLARIEAYLAYCQSKGIESATLSEVGGGVGAS